MSHPWFEDEPLPPLNPAFRRILMKLQIEAIERFLQAMGAA